jgi:phage protein U
MRKSGLPQYLMRGDGVPLGWMAVERVSEKSSYLDAKGVGRVVEVSISLKRADAPGAADFFAVISGIIE